MNHVPEQDHESSWMLENRSERCSNSADLLRQENRAIIVSNNRVNMIAKIGSCAYGEAKSSESVDGTAGLFNVPCLSLGVRKIGGIDGVDCL